MIRRKRRRSESLALRASLAALAVALVLAAAKAVAWQLTGSTAMLGSLADSCLDFLASLSVFVSLRIAYGAPSEDFRFGRGKAEAIAAFVQSAFVAVSSLIIAREAVLRLIAGVPTERHTAGIIVSFIALVATAGLVLYQRHVLRQTDSLAVKADSLHYVSDFFANGLVLFAFVLGSLRLYWVDPLVGLAIALWLLWTARGIAQIACDTLLDRELDPDERIKVETIANQTPGILRLAGLRTRRAGAKRFLELKVELDGAMRLFRANAICAGLVAELQTQFNDADVVVHSVPHSDTYPSTTP